MRIHYIAEYASSYHHRNLSHSPAGITKMDYMIDSLKKAGYMVRVVSTSRTKDKHALHLCETIRVDEQQEIYYRCTFGANNKLSKIIELAFCKIQLLLYLILKVKSDDLVVIYHERYYLSIINMAYKIKKIKFIYQVEEIYTLVAGRSKAVIQNEIEQLKVACGYIFSNDIMSKKLELDMKPSIIAHGTYRVEPRYNSTFNDRKIHVIYAGTLDSVKGGARIAAASAEFLPSNYHVHILGFGTALEIENIQNDVKSISMNSKATVSYDGILSGNEYTSYLQKCHIGLSTQNPDAEYNETSFPSKILSYMSNGLRVVTVRIRAIEESAVGNAVFYYDKQDPASVADAIKNIDMNQPYDSRRLIEKLDEQFIRNLTELIYKVSHEDSI